MMMEVPEADDADVIALVVGTEDLVIEESQTFIGHEDFERRVTILNESREFLTQHMRCRIGDDQVKADVAVAVAFCQLVIGGERLAQALAFLLEAEGEDRRVAAHQRDEAAADQVRRVWRAMVSAWLGDGDDEELADG